MQDILKEIDKVRQKIRRGATNIVVSQKPFSHGMYLFSMFMINYFSRVREHLKLDYDSFMIIQTVVSHTLHQLEKKNNQGGSYGDLETEWDKIVNVQLIDFDNFKPVNQLKLTISSICLVTKLPKETVRRKVNELSNKNLLKMSKKEGILLGANYKKVFQEFVPQTTVDVAKLMKAWEKSGVLKSILNFKM
jgi:hypothetical protein